MTSNAETVVWNRALTGHLADPGAGDEALLSILRFEQLVMDGGLSHALEVLDEDEIIAAAAGFEFFNAEDLSELIDEALAADDEADDSGESVDSLDLRYLELLPDEESLRARFNDYYRIHPEDFSPA